MQNFLAIFGLIFLMLFQAEVSLAENSIIRDTEIEKFIHETTDPIFLLAGLDPRSIKVFIIGDNSINAFVAGGQNLFINTGLIRKYKTPDALIGVIAHEVGHIAGGHLVRSYERGSSLEKQMVLGYVLGIAAIFAGSPEAGSAMILGSSQIAERSFLKFSRSQEEAADSLAIQYLAKMHYPADGLIGLLEGFDADLIGFKDKIDEYQITHPVSRKRIDLIKSKTANQKFSDQKINQKLQSKLNRILEKLEGFLDDPQKLIEKYDRDHSDRAIYIKSIAYFRLGEFKKAQNFLEKIIKISPQDGFLYELQGDFFFGSGKNDEAIAAYKKAIKNLGEKDAVISRINLANCVIAAVESEQDLLKIAIENLNQARKFENENPILFKSLSRAYEKIGDKARSALMLAEFNFLTDNKEKCQKLAKEALESLAEIATAERIRAQDLIELTKPK